MAKVYDTATDIITFARSSSGTALRRVGYGDELVDTLNQASSWQTYGSNTVEQDDNSVKITYVNNGSGAYDFLSASHGLSQDLVVGKVYKISLQAKVSSGGSVIFRIYGASLPLKDFTITSDVYVDVEYTFVAETSHLINTVGMGSGEVIWLKNFSVKEVIFDRATDPLVLFNHPGDTPRIEYGSDGSLKGLLIEEQRTNLVTYSEDFTQGWTELTSTVLPDAAVSPSGSTDATKFRGASGSTNTRLIHSSSLSSGTVYTYSLFAKAGEYTDLRVQRNDTNLASFTHTFDLSSGTSSGGVIELVGDGWFRCSGQITCTTSASTGPLFITGVGQTGDGTSGIYIYGAQLEAGSFPTSYIPTSGSQQTRSADLASIPVSAFGYNQDAGTLVVEAQTVANQASIRRVLSLDNGVTVSDSIQIAVLSGGTTIYLEARDDVTVQVSGTSGSINSAATPFRVAYAFAANDYAASVDGGALFTDTTASVPTEMTQLGIGSYISGSGSLNGHIKSIQYYPRRLTNTQLQELTA